MEKNKISEAKFFYDNLNVELERISTKEFVKYYNKMHGKLMDEYDNRVKNKTLGYKRSFLEQKINAILEANYKRSKSDVFLKEDTRNSSQLLDEVLRYFEKELTYCYLLKNNIKAFKKSNEEYVWFKVGLFFAMGEAQLLYEQYKNDKGHFTKITKELGFKTTDRPYVSETFGYPNNKGDKNIYNNLRMMRIIHSYCKKHQLNMVDDFLNAYQKITA